MNKCAVILTDGKEGSVLPSRFGDATKSTILEYVLDSVWTVADEIFVIFSGEPTVSAIETIAPFGVKAVIDRKGRSDFSMIVAGLKASSAENCLVVTSSAPFVKPNVLFQLFESIRGFDAAIPRWKSGKTEPLLSVYSRRAFLKAATSLHRQTMRGLVWSLYAVSYVEVERYLLPLDPELLTFFRVKTLADLRRARRIASNGALR